MIQSRESTIALYTREMVAAPPRAVLCRAPTGCIAHSRRERAPCVAYVGPACTACLECRVFHAVLCGTRMWYSLLFCYLASLCRLRSVMGFFYFETTPVRPRRRSADAAGPGGGRAGPPAGARAAARAIARPPRPVRAHTRSARRDRYPIGRRARTTHDAPARPGGAPLRRHPIDTAPGPGRAAVGGSPARGGGGCRRARRKRGGRPGGERVRPGTRNTPDAYAAAASTGDAGRAARLPRRSPRADVRGVRSPETRRAAGGARQRPAESGPDSLPASLPRVWVCVRRVGGRRLIPYLLSINRRAGPRNGEKPRRATARGRPGARRAGVVASPRARRRHGARRALPRPPT